MSKTIIVDSDIFGAENTRELIAQFSAFYSENDLDERLPGVTKVLSGTKDMTGLNEWRDRVGHEEADRIVEESKQIGNSLDKMFNDSLSIPGWDLDAQKGEVAYKLMFSIKDYIRKISPIGVQMKVWNKPMGYMGYLDCLGFYNGKLSIIDCKNSKREKREEHLEDYYLQCTAYALAIYEMTGVFPEQLVLVIARRDSMFPQIVVKEIKPFIRAFLARVEQYYSTQVA